ncbi:TraB/GumN family protein [Pinirhizobacter sp.]|jgi:uncharacterized protein YbaP (TraB family)|uniref:TraB/GumN family protein n=1 Tax=Pinirhizobacter sp. TaxID=2950432 RepID=UPI002F40381C
MTVGAAAMAASLGSFRAGAQTSNVSWPVWTVSDGQRSLYLVAETPPRQADWHDGRIQGLLGQCSHLWTETNQIMPADMPALIDHWGITAGHPYTASLNEVDRRRLGEAAAYCKTDLTPYAQYRPWVVAATLEDAYYAAAGQIGLSADRVLSAQAEKQKLARSSEFPTKADVITWFGGMSREQDVQFLRYTLDEVVAGPAAGARIYDAWARGDMHAATAEVQRASRAYPDLIQRLTFARNLAWMPRFKAILSSSTKAMVVVGLYHMVGPEGILALAPSHGFSVRRV